MAFFTTSDNAKIYYREAGQGKNLIMVHGYSCTGEYFKKNFPELSKYYHVINVDLRGHGNSSDVDHGMQVARLATDIHELLTELDLQDVTYLGWSMGCSIGWSYWQLFGKDRLSKFIFIDEAAWALNAPENPSNLLTFDETQAFEKSLFVDEKKAIDDFIQSALVDKSVEITDLVNDSAKAHPEFLAPLFNNHMTLDWNDTIKTITIPSLVVSGKQSFLNWKLVKKVADDIPNSRFEQFADSGHLLFIEEPERFNKLVADFIG